MIKFFLKLLLITSVLSFLFALPFFDFEKKGFERCSTTNWLELINGNVKGSMFSLASFSALVLNGDTLQNKPMCLECPMDIRFTDNDSVNFVIKAKKNLKQSKSDKLEVVFKHKIPLCDYFYPVPKFTYTIYSECDSISKIVYSKIIKIIENDQKKMDSISLAREGNIDLNEIFTRLRNNELKEWMNGQKSVVSSANSLDCYQYINALEYISSEVKSGFKPMKYDLQKSSLHENEKMTSYLNSVNEVLKSILKEFNGNNGDLEITITGYADTTLFYNPIPLIKNDNTDNIFYDTTGCSGSTLNTKRPVALEGIFQTHPQYKEITGFISPLSNCELSAVRAFFVAKDIRRQLGESLYNTKIKYYYCAGGVSKGEDLEANRKIEVSFKFIGVNKK